MPAFDATFTTLGKNSLEIDGQRQIPAAGISGMAMGSTVRCWLPLQGPLPPPVPLPELADGGAGSLVSPPGITKRTKSDNDGFVFGDVASLIGRLKKISWLPKIPFETAPAPAGQCFAAPTFSVLRKFAVLKTFVQHKADRKSTSFGLTPNFLSS
jgi:hypothetical protein